MYLTISIIIIVLVLLFKVFKNLYSRGSIYNKVPSNVKGLYDKETYKKWQQYLLENSKLDLISDIAETIIVIVLIAWVFKYSVINLKGNNYLGSLIIVAVYIACNALVSIPVSYYANFKIEEKYGFNKMTKKLFIVDKIKEMMISLILLYAACCIYIAIYAWLLNYSVILLYVVGVIIVLLMNFLAPYLVLIFNKKEPLEEGKLRDELTKLLNSNGYKVKDIYVMDASKRSTKANAFFAGFGNSKSIVLYDTIVKLLTPEELVGVFAHETGHGIHKDIAKDFFLSLINILLIIGTVFIITSNINLYSSFDMQHEYSAFGIILSLEVIIPIIEILFSLIFNKVSRKAEYAADTFSAKLCYGDYLISALKKLYKDSLGNLSPSKLEIVLDYSHPTLSDRIQNIENVKDKL
ncbi:MAG: M48 family metallopeptidase [Bacilli bacterium]